MFLRDRRNLRFEILVHNCQLLSSKSRLKLSTNQFSVLLSAERLGPLNRSTDGTVNDELRKDTQSTGDTKEDGVVVGLSKTVVLEEDTRVLYRIAISKRTLYRFVGENIQHQRWGRGSWSFRARSRHQGQCCRPGLRAWTWGHQEASWEQTRAGTCNGGQSSSGRRDHNQGQHGQSSRWTRGSPWWTGRWGRCQQPSSSQWASSRLPGWPIRGEDQQDRSNQRRERAWGNWEQIRPSEWCGQKRYHPPI